MRTFFRYWRQCIPRAAKGSAAFANDWQWLVGIPILAILLSVAGWAADMSFVGNPILGAMLAAFIAFVLTWVVGFGVRLLNAPVELDREKSEEIARLTAQLSDQTRTVAPVRDRSATSRAFDYKREQDMKIMLGAVVNPYALDIETGEDGQFVETLNIPNANIDSNRDYFVRRTLKIEIRNPDTNFR
jgi:hypothetical protein